MRPEQRITATLATFSIDRSSMPASQIIAFHKEHENCQTWTLILRGIDALKRATREISGGPQRIKDLQERWNFLLVETNKLLPAVLVLFPDLEPTNYLASITLLTAVC